MSLKDYYTLNFQLVQHHKYNLYDLESMIPWERDIYLSQLIEYIETENEKIRLKQLEATK
jgi:SET domain-containing protein